MKTFRTLWLLLGALLVVGGLPARADLLAGSGVASRSPFRFSFDENGGGSYTLNGATFFLSPGVLAPDPTQAGAPLVLTYTLPALVISGDVRVFDFGTQTLSDLLRFTNANGDLGGRLNANLMIYYSDLVGSDLADTGLPNTLHPNDGGGAAEFGTGFSWIPGGHFPAGNQYDGISGAVPEPSSLVLVATILGGGLWMRHRKLRS